MKNVLAFIFLFNTIGTLNGQSTSGSRTRLDIIPSSNIVGDNRINPVFLNSGRCEQSYYTIRLTGFDISLKEDKKLWRTYDPLIIVNVTIGDKELVRIIETTQVEKDMESLSARTVINLGLIGPYPYKGEDITIGINLFAYKTKDGLENTINALSEISDLFPNKFNSFVEVSKKVKGALDKIFNTNQKAKISYQQTWNPKNSRNQNTSGALQKGHFIIFPFGQEIEGKLIEIDEQKQITLKSDGKPLYEHGINYAVIEIENFIQREDLQTFSFYQKLEEALTHAVQNNSDAMEKTYSEFRASLYADDNFTFYDRVYIDIESYKTLDLQIKEQDSNYTWKIKPPSPICASATSIDRLIVENQIKKILISQGKFSSEDKISSQNIQTILNRLSQKEQGELAEKLNENFKIDLDKSVTEEWQEPLRTEDPGTNIDDIEIPETIKKESSNDLVKKLKSLLVLPEPSRTNSIKDFLRDSSITFNQISTWKSNFTTNEWMVFTNIINN